MELNIKNFNLFYDTFQNINKMTKGVKIVFDRNGMKCSLRTETKDESRLDVISNVVTVDSDEPIEMCTKSLNVITQILYRIIKAHAVKKTKNVSTPDFSDVHIELRDQQIFFRSNLIKTSMYLVEEAALFVPGEFKHVLNPIAELNVSTDDLKEILASTICFNDPDRLCILLCHQDDMVRNNAYACLVDTNDPRSPTFYSKFGSILFGDLTQEIYVDIARIQCMTSFPVKEMKVVLNKEPCYVAKFSISEYEYKTQYTITGKYVRKQLDVAGSNGKSN